MKKLEHLIYIVIQAFLWLQILIFSTYIVYPKSVVAGNDAEGWLRELADYHLGMQKIFLLYSLVLLIIFFVLLWGGRRAKILYFYPALAVFTASFAYFATRGYTWYFYGNNNQTVKAIVMTTICILLSFSIIFIKKFFTGSKSRSSNNYNEAKQLTSYL